MKEIFKIFLILILKFKNLLRNFLKIKKLKYTFKNLSEKLRKISYNIVILEYLTHFYK